MPALGAEGLPRYAMRDVWAALGGDPAGFERMWKEKRRTSADTWAQLMSVIRGVGIELVTDSNPPFGPEFEKLIAGRP